jgi:4-hydroxythreonine-4-phosphate dehydrogenase
MSIPHKVKVGISIGCFNGIGVEVILKSLADRNITDFFTPIIFGSAKLLSYQKNIFKGKHNFYSIDEVSKAHDNKINVLNLHKENVNVSFGQATEESSLMAINSLNAATKALQDGDIDVLVTAPIHKDEMKKHGFEHTGHTEYLESKFKQKALMFMVTDDLKVAVSTHHIALQEVPAQISTEKIYKQCKSLLACLVQDFAVRKPKIAVLGLNPHAGDNGLMGKEEKEIIIPAIQKLNKEGHVVHGPFPADSFFQPNKYKHYDAVLAMYHDQGLTPFKTLAYDIGVNYSAALRYVRTSPDHGVAYDIAGKNLADETSMREAIFTAVKIFKTRTEHQELVHHQLKKQRNVPENGIDEDLPEEND